MPLTQQVDASLTTMLELQAEATASHQARADFTRNSDAQEFVANMASLELSAHMLQQNPAPRPADLKPVSAMITETCLPGATVLINANLVQMRMGPLNTSRVIEPTSAKKQNALLTKLQKSYISLAALLAHPEAAIASENLRATFDNAELQATAAFAASRKIEQSELKGS